MSIGVHRPHVGLSTVMVAGLTAIWGILRLVIFDDSVFPLTFVLPLLICVWTRQRWQLWGMALVFAAMAVAKALRLSAVQGGGTDSAWFLVTTLANIVIGAAVVQVILSYRDRIEAAHARISEQNAELELQAERLQQQNTELEAQAEELAQQNEEIRTQTEELAQQFEETEAQSEELAQQNEELADANQRLRSREDLLQAMLEATHSPGAVAEGLTGVCARALVIMGAPAGAVAVLLRGPQGLFVRAQAGASDLVPETWPIDGSIARVVLDEERTAYVSDFAGEPALSAPFGSGGVVQSVLATPLRIAGKCEGIVVACSPGPAHWSAEQFRLIEWFAAQCGLIKGAQRWQAALEKHAGDAEAANAAKDRFLAMLSHELRTPLTPVLAAAGALANDATLSPAVREELAMIRRNISIQNRLIDDLLDLTRIGRGKMVLERERLDPATLVRSAHEITAPDLDARDQRLTVELSALDGCEIDGDGARLQQVIWNLLKNAVKFSPPGSEIGVTAGRRDNRVRIEVRDRGIGLAAVDLERIFLPFEQVHFGNGNHGTPGSSGNNGTGGLGLGLAIARTIAELHGGKLTAESAGVGRGATFVLELPVLPRDRAVRPVSPAPVASASAIAPLRILLTEDHLDTGRLLTRLLQVAGHQVDYAPDGTKALALAAPGRFDLLVSDLGLPDFDGCELLRRLRAIDPHIAGICMSGYGAEQDIHRAREAGFTEHLTKPVELHNLHAAIARMAKLVEARRAGGPAAG